jgi:hypothetical protein
MRTDHGPGTPPPRRPLRGRRLHDRHSDYSRRRWRPRPDSAITIGADGLGLISYRDFQEDAVKVAHCADVACTSVTTAVG